MTGPISEITSKDLIDELCRRNHVAVILLARIEKQTAQDPGDSGYEVECHTEGPMFAFIGLAESFVTMKKNQLVWGDLEEEM